MINQDDVEDFLHLVHNNLKVIFRRPNLLTCHAYQLIAPSLSVGTISPSYSPSQVFLVKIKNVFQSKAYHPRTP